MYIYKYQLSSVADVRRGPKVASHVATRLLVPAVLCLSHVLLPSAFGAVLILGDAVDQNGTIAIPVELSALEEEGIAALQFDLHFDAERYTFGDVARGDVVDSADKEVIFSELADGTIRVVVAGFASTNLADGTLMTLYLDSSDQTATSELGYGLEDVILSGFRGESIEEKEPEAADAQGPLESTVPNDVEVENDGPYSKTFPRTDTGDTREGGPPLGRDYFAPGYGLAGDGSTNTSPPVGARMSTELAAEKQTRMKTLANFPLLGQDGSSVGERSDAPEQSRIVHSPRKQQNEDRHSDYSRDAQSANESDILRFTMASLIGERPPSNPTPISSASMLQINRQGGIDGLPAQRVVIALAANIIMFCLIIAIRRVVLK